jgi:hypothetical protein
LKQLGKGYNYADCNSGVDVVLDKMSMDADNQAEWRAYQAMLPKGADDMASSLHTQRPPWLPPNVLWLGAEGGGWKLPQLVPASYKAAMAASAEASCSGAEATAAAEAVAAAAAAAAAADEQQQREAQLQQEQYQEQVQTATQRQEQQQAAARNEADMQCIVCGSGGHPSPPSVLPTPPNLTLPLTLQMHWLVDESSDYNPIIQCSGHYKHKTGLHSYPKIGWHTACMPQAELEMPLEELINSPDYMDWACKSCAVQLASQGVYIDWKLTNKTHKAVKVSGKRRQQRRVAYAVQWLGEQPPSVEVLSSLQDTQSLRWYRDTTCE